jgi:hypothetical protein
MRTALADKDLNVRLRTRRLACRVPKRASLRGQDKREGEGSVCDHDFAATQDVN